MGDKGVGSGFPLPGAVVVALLAFLLYHSTLLPGFDLGDTPSFQVMSGSPVITPRDGYPLYFALGSLFVGVSGDHARGMNLASAVEAAVACGIIVLVASELSGSVLAGAAAAWLFAGSYTFWSQSIIAEVYALHMAFIALTLWLLLRWEATPTATNLGWFFVAYALGFGNHLTMILLAPAFALFLLVRAPGGWRTLFAPGLMALALVIAAAGALQYAWNIRALWLQPLPPASLLRAMQTFWFDVTKSDWRDTMLLQVPKSMAGERLRMYAFDVRQQFGWTGPVLAICGLTQLVRAAPRRALLIGAAFLANVLFALGYNVGDSHVFFLPSHLMLALLAAPGLMLLEGFVRVRSLVPVLALALAGSRIYRDYPALDRSDDTRPATLLGALTAGVDDRHAILLTDFNWQVENGLTYFAKYVHPEVAFARMPDVLLYAPALIRDNLAIGRETLVSARARDTLSAAYGPLFEALPDSRVAVPTLPDLTHDLPAGTRYVMCVLKPLREFSLDEGDLGESLRSLTGGRLGSIGSDDYAAIGGLVGEQPVLLMSSMSPFQTTADLDGTDVIVRMESWLAFDTIRRMGFGHIIASRHHTLIVERGVSFVAFGADGRPLRVGYAAGIFAPRRGHSGRHPLKGHPEGCHHRGHP